MRLTYQLSFSAEGQLFGSYVRLLLAMLKLQPTIAARRSLLHSLGIVSNGALA